VRTTPLSPTATNSVPDEATRTVQGRPRGARRPGHAVGRGENGAARAHRPRVGPRPSHQFRSTDVPDVWVVQARRQVRRAMVPPSPTVDGGGRRPGRRDAPQPIGADRLRRPHDPVADVMTMPPVPLSPATATNCVPTTPRHTDTLASDWAEALGMWIAPPPVRSRLELVTRRAPSPILPKRHVHVRGPERKNRRTGHSPRSVGSRDLLLQ